MRLNTQDLTLQRNYLQKYQFLISEYEQVKNKIHPKFKKIKDFYKYHHTCAQSFLKYYSRFKQSGQSIDLMPQKRGPRYRTRRPLPFIEEKVKQLRELGNNRYEIVNILKPKLKNYTPSASGVYNIISRLGLNRLNPPMKKNRRVIIKEKAGDMAHIDCHYLSQNIIKNETNKLFLVCVIDDYSRIAWAELTTDVTSLTVMFATLKCFNYITSQYQIKFSEVLTDNGSEFGKKGGRNNDQHPFERMLIEMNIKHRYTKPYRPQTNGKVERLWRTIEDDMLRDNYYGSVEELKQELINYLVYYNDYRPHQSLGGRPPKSQISSTNY